MSATASGTDDRGPGEEALVGVISDTHGLLRSEAMGALEECDLIVHAGDVGGAGILDSLSVIAPVRAVRGNVDTHGEVADLPLTEVVEIAGATLYVIHIVDDLDLDPAAAGFDAVVFGHSHRPSVERRGGVLWLNPGSAGPRRFDRPVTVARLCVRDGRLDAEHVTLS